MEAALSEFLRCRFGSEQATCIAQRWRANFGLVEGTAALPCERHQEYNDLLALLTEFAREASEEIAAVARWLAYSCTGENHLWEDLGLPERPALTSLIADCFPQLRQLNSQNMRWKKFFYKQLCSRAQVSACRAPTCDQCSEFALCFETPADQQLDWEFPLALAVRRKSELRELVD